MNSVARRLKEVRDRNAALIWAARAIVIRTQLIAMRARP